MGLHFRENLGSLPCPTFTKAQRVSLGGGAPIARSTSLVVISSLIDLGS